MDIEPKNFHKFLAPRPVALVTTVDLAGNVNCAPFSFMTPVSMQPPLIAISIVPNKDAMKNIRATKSFVVNIPSEELLDKLWICSQNYPPGTNELKKAELTEVPAEKGKPPLIAECITWFECDLESEKPAGDHVLVLGRVKVVTVKNDIIAKDGGVDIAKAKSLMHIGGSKFAVAEKEVLVSKKENESQ